MNKVLLATFVAVLGFSFSASVTSADRGTKEEAVVMVQNAVAYYKAYGKEKTIAELNSSSGQFRSKDMYVNATGMDGMTLAHANAKLVGKNVFDLKDVDGKYIVREYINIAKSPAGKGWVSYKWANPAGGIDEKTTYVEKVDDFILGCGVFITK